MASVQDGDHDGAARPMVTCEEDADELQVVNPRTQRERRVRQECGGDFVEESSKLLHAPTDLWLVYFVKITECTAYYGVSYVFTHYLTEEFGMTDFEAGNIYACYGLLCTVLGFLMGVSIDRLGVRKAMIVGCFSNTVARFIWCTTSSQSMVILASVTAAPLGAAFGVPSLALGVRRYTHAENRAFAFSFFYMALCLACIMSSIIINRIRSSYIDGIEIMGSHYGWMRLVCACCAVLTAMSAIAAFFVRDIQIRSDMPLEDQAYDPHRYRGRTDLKEILSQKRFKRVVAVTFIFCGVRMAFRHLDATFPKYFIRTYGRDAPFEMITGLEPLLTLILSPFVTLALVKLEWRLPKIFTVGAFISGISVFMLTLEETYNSAIAFVVVLALGEAIWSPKLYEFTTMAAPEGREGIYVACAFAPMYLSSVPVGWLSGWALSVFCSRDAAPEERQGQAMWFVIGLTSFSSFVLMYMCQKRLFPSDDDDSDDDGHEEAAAQTEDEF